MSLSKEDQNRIANAIHSAETKTACQIVCVLAKTSSQYTSAPIIFASLAALVTPWLLMAYTAMSVQLILTSQVIVFMFFTLLFCAPRIRVSLLPRKARRAVAHRAAMEQFYIRGLGRTKERSGILIFVSLAERYARIVCDDAIAQLVPQREWQTAVDALTAHMRDGRIADGFIAVIDVGGQNLARHFPPTLASNNALPDRIYEI